MRTGTEIEKILLRAQKLRAAKAGWTQGPLYLSYFDVEAVLAAVDEVAQDSGPVQPDTQEVSGGE